MGRIVGGGQGVTHWFEPLAEHMGPAYLRYSFTKGTKQEIDFLWSALGLEPGSRVLDVGCGPGRHALELGRRGAIVHGVDISDTFVALGRQAAAAEGLVHVSFERRDARDLRDVSSGRYDAVVCLCQGAFGLMTADGDDRSVVEGLVHQVGSGGTIALSAFNAYFAVRYHVDSTFDAATGVSHEVTEIRSPNGESRTADLWTGCYTPRELRLLLASAGADVVDIWSVEPGDYGRRPPDTEHPEFLALARRRSTPVS